MEWGKVEEGRDGGEGGGREREVYVVSALSGESLVTLV